MAHGTFHLGGNVTVRLRGPDGGERQWRTANVVTSGGLSLIRDYLLQSDASAAPNAPLFIAVGSGTVPVGRFMTAVPGEYYRVAIAQRDPNGFAAIYHGYFSSVDANAQSPALLIAEDLAGANVPISSIIGVVAGNAGMTLGCYGLYGGDATDVVGTGTLVALANEPIPFNKNSTNSFNLDWSLAVSGQY